jgi:serine/threonine protein kinase
LSREHSRPVPSSTCLSQEDPDTLSLVVAIEPGRLLGREFVIERPLSAGGMGSVYIALQKSTGIRRALKVMHTEIVREQKSRQRFIQEARVAGHIQSDHVVQIITAGVDEGTSIPFLVMELLDGCELAAFIRDNGRTDERTLGIIFQQLCHAVGAAHRSQIVHRDLKPENIFLANSRVAGTPFMVKVLDFGIAKIVAEARASATEAMGTPLWMAPEQTASGSPVSPQTDVWALGLIAFFCMTGRTYWSSADEHHPSLARILRQMLVDDLALPSERAASLGVALPTWFDEWFGLCVQRDPKARFVDAERAWDALDRCLRRPATTAPMPANSTPEIATPGVTATLPFEAGRHSSVPIPTIDSARAAYVPPRHASRSDTTPLAAASGGGRPSHRSHAWLTGIIALAVGAWIIRSMTMGGPDTPRPEAGPERAPPEASIPPPATAVVSDVAVVTNRVKAWNLAHAAFDTAALATLYADEVLYYGTLQSGDACVKAKRTFFTKNAGFRQELTGDIRTQNDGDDLRADFLKRVVTPRGKVTDYPSYLVFRHLGSEWRIVTEGDTVTDANLAKKAITYATNKSPTKLISSLTATVNGNQYILVDESEETCLSIEAQKDFDGNGTMDALIRHSTACGGICCGDHFFFYSYADGHFEKSEEVGYARIDPKVERWRGRWSVLITSNNEGANQFPPEERTERFVLELGKAVLVESSKRESLSADVELKSDVFDMNRDDERYSITADLDGDGSDDRIFGRLWRSWGRMFWWIEFANGKTTPESNTACKRIGVLRTKTGGVLDLVCDQDTVLHWNGTTYQAPK